MPRVLVVDDDPCLRHAVEGALLHQNFQVDSASNGEEAILKCALTAYDLVLMDVNMPQKTGIEALKQLKRNDPTLTIVIITAYSNIAEAVEAVKEGAYNYIEKPLSTENLVRIIKKSLRAKSLVETTAFSAPILQLGKNNDCQNFIGESKPMIQVFNIIQKLAKVNTPVLIRGESGTGKELVARAIHFNGPRKDEKFVTINCAALSESLVESELFGHEKGAFTGAIERKIGKFQYANGGTLFLDEIGDISINMQVKLLRVLQNNIFNPVGSNREIKADVRIIAASNKNFEEMIHEKIFREDLFYRLNVLPVYLPPLRDRMSDIEHLIKYFLHHFNRIHNLEISGISEEASNAIICHNWPGNIRELRNAIEHAFIMESTNIIQFASLPSNIKNVGTKIVLEEDEDYNGAKNINLDMSEIKSNIFHENESQNKNKYLHDFSKILASLPSLDFQTIKSELESQFLTFALKQNNGRINQTAIKANIPKKTLLRKMEKYNIIATKGHRLL